VISEHIYVGVARKSKRTRWKVVTYWCGLDYTIHIYVLGILKWSSTMFLLQSKQHTST